MSLDADELVVGREDGTDLVLDDALVSRRHARFRVTPDGVEVEDLGSRNGVHVNGVRIDGPRRLALDDSVRIGSQVLVLSAEGGRRRSERPMTTELVPCPRCGAVAPAASETCPNCHTSLHPEASTPEAAVGAGRSTLGALSSLADKALSLGRSSEAERILASSLDAVLQDARTGNTPDDATLGEAVGYALKLADAGLRPRVEYVFNLYAALRRIIPAEVVERLYSATSASRYADPRPIRTYLESMKPQAPTLGANERFLLQRLEGLERRVRSA